MSNFNRFNIYEIYNPKDRINNSYYGLEGCSPDTKTWERLSNNRGLVGFNSLEEIVERIVEVRKDNLDWINIQTDSPKDSHAIHYEDGIMVMGKDGVELAMKLDSYKMIELAKKLQKKIDKLKKYSR